MAKPNWKNRTLLHGDNLEFLRSLNSETVHLIATDPPFNKGRDFHATPDSLAKGASFQDRWSWDKDVDDTWIDKITDDFPKVMNVINGSRNSYGDDMGAFLCFMAVRILEMHRVLRKDGSIYLHCDDTAVHYLKELMDAIFGRDNFRNEIVWERTRGMSAISKNFRRVSDRILRYGKTNKYVFTNQHLTKSDAYIKMFNKKDEHGYYYSAKLLGPGPVKNGETGKPWRGVDPNKQGKSGSHWIYKHEKLNELEMQGKVLWPKKTGGTPRVKYYLHDSPGVKVTDIWVDIPAIESHSKESVDYPTQKPLELYERIIEASSNKGDIVLDPFCGCATTCVAAERLGRQWIGIDIWDKAHKTVIDRLKKDGRLAGPQGHKNDVLVKSGIKITYTKKTLKRTDDKLPAVPYLPIKMRQFDDSEKDPHTNPEKKQLLLERDGPYCQGCGNTMTERYFELDHKEPRSAGGSNLLRNRILLCGPCNKLKRDQYTIPGLRKENKKLGYMVNEKVLVPLK